MRSLWQRATARVRLIFGVLVAFVVARVLLGFVLIALDADRAAWGIEATVIVIGALAVYLLVALVLRRRTVS
jgi:hypothetical protein